MSVKISADVIKELREMTGVGPLDCKKALEQHGGDLQAAANYLREKGLAKAAKKAGRVANEGIIHTYQHFNGRLAVVLEVNCETDFVAKTEAFKQFAHDLALHIANLAPNYLKRDDIPAGILAQEKEIQRRRALEEGKPENVVDKIVEGRMGKFYEEVVLMDQRFLKDDSKTIEDVRKELVASLGENIVIRRFARFELGAAGDETQEDEG